MTSPISIFDQEWWYDAATDGKWQKAEFDDGKVLSASLIYSTYRENGLKVVGMPRLARVMQPKIKFHSVEARRNLSHIIRALNGLAEQLPKFDRFNYMLPPDSGLELAFDLAGFTVAASFTFCTTSDPEHDPWTQMEKKTRYNITSGLKRIEVVEHFDIDRYVNLSRKFIGGRAFKDTVDYAAVRRILAAAIERQQAVILSCLDDKGADIAGAVLLLDGQHVYYWLHSRDPDSNDPSTNSVMIWKAIEKARSMGLIFDMDGYSSANTGVFLSRFGLLARRRSEVSILTNAAMFRMAASRQVRSLVGPKLRQQLLSIRNTLRKR